MDIVKRNIGYSMLLTGANYFFPLAVYSYVSRVLGVGNVGLIGFIDSVTVWFILFSMMGISVLGIRAVARARGDARALSSAFWSLLAIHFLFTLVVLAAMVAATLLVEELRANRHLMFVGMCKLIFNVFLVEWLFVGLEQFRFITIRTLIIKAGYVASVFMFVKSPGDTYTYYVLTMLVVVAMAIVNMSHACRDVGISRVRLSIRNYLKPFFSLGLYAVVTTTYVTFNMAYLGFVADDASVGCFSTSSKIISLVAVVFTAYISVMTPRANRQWATGERGQFIHSARRSALVVLCVGIPLGAAVYCLAPMLVGLLSGAGYEGAVGPLRLMAPFLVVIGMSQMITMQILIPTGCENRVAFNSLCGFAVCVLLNVLLTSRLLENGSALAWIAGETTALLLGVRCLMTQYGSRFFVIK